jgi:CYTH domain-containing protein
MNNFKLAKQKAILIYQDRFRSLWPRYTTFGDKFHFFLFKLNNKYYEIDIYPEWKKQAIMEIELKSEDEEVILPEGIKVIKEVTGDPSYSNFEMAKNMPEE